MELSPAQRWSPLLTLAFFTFVVFLFFHLYLRPQSAPEATVVSAPTLEAPTVSVINPSRGPENAPITMVEFGDFQCEACRDLSAALDTLARDYPDAIRIVWRDFPNESLHREATPAAIAARCAGEQGAFWSYHDLLFTQTNSLNANTYATIARGLNLNLDAWNACVNARTPLPRIQRDFEEGLALSITATPTLFVNRERFVGALDIQKLREIIKPYL